MISGIFCTFGFLYSARSVARSGNQPTEYEMPSVQPKIATTSDAVSPSYKLRFALSYFQVCPLRTRSAGSVFPCRGSCTVYKQPTHAHTGSLVEPAFVGIQAGSSSGPTGNHGRCSFGLQARVTRINVQQKRC